MNRHRIGVALPPEYPLEDLVAAARVAEALGCDYVWVNDDRLQKDVFTVLAALACETERILLGPGVTNPYSRHPALIATAIATLDELSKGRAVLGLGTGGTNHRALGVSRRKPAVAMREAVDLVRALWAGHTVNLDGEVIRAEAARLDFVPYRSRIPLYIGARGPQLLELAGELADGVIVGNIASHEGWNYALGRILAGAERGGRNLAELSITAWFACCIADDPVLALDAVRPLVATSLVTSRPVLHELGVALPKPFADLMEQMSWSPSAEAVALAGTAVPDELVHRFALAGTGAECHKRLSTLLATFPQISQISIIPFPLPGESVADVVGRFMHDVAFEPRSPVAGSRRRRRDA